MIKWSFVHLDEATSTQSIAKSLASMGAPEGTTIVAKTQSSGEGRLGRKWVSPPGGLYMSFVLRPSSLPKPEQAALVGALAIVKGVKKSTGIETRIRWPNDVMAAKKKVAGVLAEAQSYGDDLTEITVGVGLNCNSKVEGPRDLQATSLHEVLGAKVDLTEVRKAILGTFSDLYDSWQGGEDMSRPWSEVQIFGGTVAIKLKTENPFSGKTSGLNAEGNLVVSVLGRLRTIRSEDLEWLTEK
ncbi:MAG TPA: biotin--[acetyl-CoA-carboxylase] ligase [Nitrososphaerales archaeon]|nr:biotin--[acetyl-CoA-carboxylase] ligase [Nitrososphaerales archaeon]